MKEVVIYSNKYNKKIKIERTSPYEFTLRFIKGNKNESSKVGFDFDGDKDIVTMLDYPGGPLIISDKNSNWGSDDAMVSDMGVFNRNWWDLKVSEIDVENDVVHLKCVFKKEIEWEKIK